MTARIFTLLLLLSTAGFVSAGNVDSLKANIVRFLTASDMNASGAELSGALTRLRDTAQTCLNTCRSDGSWADIDYLASGGVYWDMSKHYIRLYFMAMAYSSPGQALYHDAVLLDRTGQAFDYMHRYVYKGCSFPGNLWFYKIGLPMYVGPALILMQDRLDTAVANAVCSTLVYLIASVPWNPTEGANGIWIALNRVYNGVLTRDSSAIAANVAFMSNLCGFVTPPAEGVLPDYTFWTHGPYLYTGGYGKNYLSDMARILAYTKGTAFQFGSDKVAFFTGYAAEGARWCVVGDHYDPAVINREISRSGGAGSADAAFVAFSVLARQIANARQDDFIAVLKKMLENGRLSSMDCLAPYGLLDLVKQSAVPGAWPSVHRHCPYSDYTIHRGADYFMSVKMLSTRMAGMDLTNGEGTSARHYGEGTTFIMTRGGDEFYTRDVLPILDWGRLPGVTREAGLELSTGGGYTQGKRSFAGGVTLDDNGVSAMDMAANTSALVAKKSWFMFGKTLICLGAGISCPNPHRAETIVNQRAYFSDSTPVYVDGVRAAGAAGWNATLDGVSWVYSDSIAYFFPEKGPIEAQVLNQTGRWSKISSAGSNTLCGPLPVLTLYFDHGAFADNRSYSYGVTPALSYAQAQALAQRNALWLLENDTNVQAVYDSASRVTGAVFYRAGAGAQLRVDRGCIVTYSEEADSFIIGLCDPTFAAGAVHVTVPEPLTAGFLQNGVSAVVQGDSTLITFNVDKGASFTARFARQRTGRGMGLVTVLDQDGVPVAGAHVAILSGGKTVFSGASDKLGRLLFSAPAGGITLAAGKTSFFAVESLHLTLGSALLDTAIRLDAAAPLALRIMPESLTLIEDDSAALSVNALYADNGERTCPEALTWTSGSAGIVQVDVAGTVRSSDNAGTATVYCTGQSSGLADSIRVTVLPQRDFPLPPTDDAYIVGYDASRTQYHNDTNLFLIGYVPADTGDAYGKHWIYLKFSLAGMDSVNMLSAKLRLSLKAGADGAYGAPVPATVFAVRDTDWTEETLCWNNRPMPDSTGLSTIVIQVPTYDRTFPEWDVTAWARACRGKSMGLFIRNTGGGPNFTFSSKEASSNRPLLIIREDLDASTLVEEEPDGAVGLSLTAAPNPFNPSVHIRLSGVKNKAGVRIFSPTGRLVSSLEADKDGVEWNASSMPSGLYLIEIKADKMTLRTKAVLLK